MSTETVVDPDLAKSTGVSNPLVLIQAAIDRGINPDQLGKLLDLQERWEANRAREAFSAAMNDVQRIMPVVVRDAENKQTSSRYAKFENVQIIARPVYTDHGFSLSFSEADSPVPGFKRTICKVRHIAGHSEDHHLDLPIDGIGPKGNPIGGMNAVQGAISTMSYGQRKLLCMIFNITVADEDKDGQDAHEFVTEDERTELEQMFMAKFKGYSEADFADRRKRFLVYVGAETFQQILRSKLGIAREALKIKKNGGTK